jgi:hypothetical protein
MLDSVNQGKDPSTQGGPKSSVLLQITKIIGVHPSRTDLIQIVVKRNWMTLTRNERRLKSAVVAKLESMHEQLLPELETRAGVKDLQDAYRAIALKDQLVKANRQPQTAAIPPITTISFYLNH